MLCLFVFRLSVLKNCVSNVSMHAHWLEVSSIKTKLRTFYIKQMYENLEKTYISGDTETEELATVTTKHK